jgi:hypothetical protein
LDWATDPSLRLEVNRLEVAVNWGKRRTAEILESMVVEYRVWTCRAELTREAVTCDIRHIEVQKFRFAAKN